MKVEDFDALDEERREAIREKAQEKGAVVYSLDYDSGAPGGGGYDRVARYRGLFFVFSLDDHPASAYTLQAPCGQGIFEMAATAWG